MPKNRTEIDTPALIIDLDALERNIARMAQYVREKKINLRPHAKTHKSVEIARRQIAAGALGVCVAKLGEGEALRDGGIETLHITSPVVTSRGIQRLIALNERSSDIMTVCDNMDVARHLGAAARASGKPLKLLVDLDPGGLRTGIEPGPKALALAEFVAAEDGLTLAGVQCYAGSIQHVHNGRDRKDRSLAVWKTVADFLELLDRHGIRPEIVSGAGTGTFNIDSETKILTELQAGSYIFMDRAYNDVWNKEGGEAPFETSLFVQATVISLDHRTELGAYVTADAGIKSFATDDGTPVIVSGAPKGAKYTFAGDEHARIYLAEDGPTLAIGDVITCIVPHCDPTVNLYDRYHVLRGDVVEAIWPVDARGRSA